jgi:hypothetical protein
MFPGNRQKEKLNEEINDFLIRERSRVCRRDVYRRLHQLGFLSPQTIRKCFNWSLLLPTVAKPEQTQPFMSFLDVWMVVGHCFGLILQQILATGMIPRQYFNVNPLFQNVWLN